MLLEKLNSTTVHLIDYFDQEVDVIRSGCIGRASMSWIFLHFSGFLGLFGLQLDSFLEQFAQGEDKLKGEVLEIRIGDILS